MRTLFLLLALPLAACGSADEPAGNAATPAPRPSGPPPRTPVIQVTPAPGNEATWMEPRTAPDDPVTAPYGNLLDAPLVKDGKR